MSSRIQAIRPFDCYLNERGQVLAETTSDMQNTVYLSIINAIFVPSFTYQCQTWTLTKTLERKLVTCDMRCIRKAVNKTRHYRIKVKEQNEVIRATVGTQDQSSIMENINESSGLVASPHQNAPRPTSVACIHNHTLAGKLEDDQGDDGATL